MGGRIAKGAGLRPLPVDAAAADNLNVALIVCGASHQRLSVITVGSLKPKTTFARDLGLTQ